MRFRRLRLRLTRRPSATYRFRGGDTRLIAVKQPVTRLVSPPPSAPFFLDRFDTQDGTALEDHAPDIGGPWTLVFGSSAAVESGAATTTAEGVYLAGTDAPDDYAVRAILLPVITEEEGEEPTFANPNVRVCGRMSTEGDIPDDMYCAWFKPSGLAGRWTLTQRVAGSETDLDDGPSIAPPSEPTTAELVLGPDYQKVKINGEVVASSALPAPTTLTEETTLPAATVNVALTLEFNGSGALLIGGQTVTYTGKTATSFTGCSGGTGTFPAGTVVTQVLPPVPTGGVPGLHWPNSGTSAAVEEFSATDLAVAQRPASPTRLVNRTPPTRLVSHTPRTRLVA